jgi:predicted lipid-binding transport protein (Tim44 family)
MRRLIGWMAGLAGVAALAKLLHTRPQPALPPAQPAGGDDPAEELRRKLAEARATAAATPDAPPAEAPAPVVTGTEGDEPAPTGPSIDDRRADVHARAQAAIDAMRNPDE